MSKKLLLLLVPPLIILLSWASLYQSPLEVLQSEGLELSAFTDEGIDKGRSEIVKVEDSSDYKAIWFKLEEGFISPYAGISFFTPEYWDISAYDEIEVAVDLENTKNLELTIATYQDGITKEHEPLSFRHNVIEIPITGERGTYHLELDRMQTAQWWLERFKVRSTELGEPRWQMTSSASLVAKIRLNTDKAQLLKVNTITFVKDLTWFYIAAATFGGLWYVGMFLFFRYNVANNRREELVIRYRQAENSVTKEESGNEIFDCISEHYQDPELTLGKLSDIVNISEKAISAAIKNAYNMSFKEYINGIRINEAKRLLKDTDKNVSEIAYQVGFNSPNHFNRTFKASEGCTPTEYRTRILAIKPGTQA